MPTRNCPYHGTLQAVRKRNKISIRENMKWQIHRTFQSWLRFLCYISRINWRARALHGEGRVIKAVDIFDKLYRKRYYLRKKKKVFSYLGTCLENALPWLFRTEITRTLRKGFLLGSGDTFSVLKKNLISYYDVKYFYTRLSFLGWREYRAPWTQLSFLFL